MTVKYTDTVATVGSFGSFFKLLMKWRGSVYKMIWQDMLVYLVLYTLLSLVYRLALPPLAKEYFEMLVIHCARFRDLIPVSFVLGFYVSLVVKRWWDTYQSIPWPDTAAVLAWAYIPGLNQERREVRSRLLRYINLTIALIYASISPVVNKEFTSLRDYRKNGYNYLTETELGELERLKTDHHKAWVPLLWACDVIYRAREDGLIRMDLGQKTLIDEVTKIREKCMRLLAYSNINIPLVYTQVVTIAVYSFFVFSLLGEQYLDPASQHPDHKIDAYVPVFALLQLFFYIGWLKVAEALLNPFGTDDHDIEFLDLLKKHLQMTQLLCDPVYMEEPCTTNLPQEQTVAGGDDEKEQQQEQQMCQSNNNIELVVVKSSTTPAINFPSTVLCGGTIVNSLSQPLLFVVP